MPLIEVPSDKRGIDVGERHDLGLAVVPAPAAEQSDVVGHGLFEVDDVAVFDAARAGLRNVEIERRIVQRLAIAAGIGAVEPGDGAQLSGLREQRIAGFQFDHILAALRTTLVSKLLEFDTASIRK